MSRKQSGGFAVIYALIFVAAVSALSVGFFTVIKNFYDREAAVELESQFSRVVKDFPKLIQIKLSKIQSETDFEYFLRNESSYSFSDQEFDINVSLKPMNDRIIFADMFDIASGNIKPDYLRVFSQTLDFYGLRYKPLFLAMLQDGVDKDVFEREPFSELSKKDRAFQDGEIESYDKLQKIVAGYKLETGDTAIDAIDWRLFFNFYKKPAQYFVDCKIMTSEVYSFIAAYSDDPFYDCTGFEKSKNYEKFKTSFSIISFNPKSPYSFLVDVNISKNKTQHLEKKFIYESGSKQITLVR